MNRIGRLYFFISVLILVSCKNEKGFTIKARITGIPDSTKVMLQNLTTSSYLDSTVVINNEFSFNGYLGEEPEELRIISEETKNGNLYYTDILIGNEDIRLEADVLDLPYNVNSFGSPTQKEAEIYHKQIHEWKTKITSLRKKMQAIPDSVNSTKKNLINLKITETRDSLYKWDAQYLKDNFNSFVALVAYNYRRDFTTDILDSLYTNLSTELRESKYGKAIRTQIEFPAPKLGDEYYDFNFSDYNDKRFRLSTVKDKYILLQFAGTRCYWSDLAVKHIKEIYGTHSDSLVFVSVFIDSKEDYQKYVAENKIPWSSTWSPDGRYGEPICKYGIVGTPTFYLISPDKKIVANWFGYEDGIIETNIGSKLATSRR
jgi:hypothetical protein